MKYILIALFWTYSSGHNGLSVEFNSEQACEAAKSILMERKHEHADFAFCTEKGMSGNPIDIVPGGVAVMNVDSRGI